MESKKYIEKIIFSDDENKKHEMTDYIYCLIKKLSSEEEIDEAKRKLYEMSEGKILNEEKAEHLISNMKPFGKKWELADTEQVRMNCGFDNIRPVDFWIVMNSAFNDYNDLFRDDVNLYAKYSRDFICDEDAVNDKVYYYFTMIPR
jgi:hypothetical protein